VPWFYYVCRALVGILVPLLSRWQVKGKENIPLHGPLLVVANHLNLADPPLLGIALGRRVIFMAKEELFRSRLMGYFVGGLGSFPVHRRQLDLKAIRQAERVLSDGLALAIFPEATRSKDTRLQPGLPGSALIALRQKIPVLPVGITGTEKINGLGWLLRRPPITINFGHTFHLPQVNGKVTRGDLERSTSLIMEHIAELLPEEYQKDELSRKELDGIND